MEFFIKYTVKNREWIQNDYGFYSNPNSAARSGVYEKNYSAYGVNIKFIFTVKLLWSDVDFI